MAFLLVLLLSAFATFRLSIMFAKETGPCRMFERIRARFDSSGCWHKGISCVLCETVWWSGIITLWLLVSGFLPWQLTGVFWLGVSGIAVIINEHGPKFD
jgi:hypothetical protein